MKRELGRLAVTGLIAAGLGVVALIPAARTDDSPKKAPAAAKMAKPGSFMAVMEKSHREMMGMKMTGDADKDFAMMMSMHHKSGIEMAEIELRDGHDAKMREMAQKIIDSQKKEIAEFEAWLAEKGGHKH